MFVCIYSKKINVCYFVKEVYYLDAWLSKWMSHICVCLFSKIWCELLMIFSKWDFLEQFFFFIQFNLNKKFNKHRIKLYFPCTKFKKKSHVRTSHTQIHAHTNILLFLVLSLPLLCHHHKQIFSRTCNKNVVKKLSFATWFFVVFRYI